MSEGEWDLNVNEIIDKTCEKMKSLNKRKDQLEVEQMELCKERENIEKSKLELKFMVSKMTDEITKLSQNQF